MGRFAFSSLNLCVHFILSEHLRPAWPHFKCSVATCGQELLCWAVWFWTRRRGKGQCESSPPTVLCSEPWTGGLQPVTWASLDSHWAHLDPAFSLRNSSCPEAFSPPGKGQFTCPPWLGSVSQLRLSRARSVGLLGSLRFYLLVNPFYRSGKTQRR